MKRFLISVINTFSGAMEKTTMGKWCSRKREGISIRGISENYATVFISGSSALRAGKKEGNDE